MIASTVREISALADAATPGAQTMLGRLMELLFVEVLRRYAARCRRQQGSWFAALNDPIVGRALCNACTPTRRERWTARDLAREAGTSRTVLTERFNALLGRPPIDYVTSWRIQLAAERLRNGNDIGGIASDIGYELEAAFNRAFKRVTGITPGAGGRSRLRPRLLPVIARRPKADAAIQPALRNPKGVAGRERQRAKQNARRPQRNAAHFSARDVKRHSVASFPCAHAYRFTVAPLRSFTRVRAQNQILKHRAQWSCSRGWVWTVALVKLASRQNDGMLA